MHNLISSSARSSMPRVTAIETGSAVPSLSMISVVAVPVIECPGAVSPDAFFPANKDSDYASARAFCADCPFVDRCRTWGDAVERDVPKSSVCGMLAGETPRERIVRRVMAAPAISDYPELRHCAECDSPIRPARTRARDYPGTKTSGGYGLCGACYHRAHKAVAA